MKCFGQKIRNYHCKVVLLDDQELIQEIQSTSTGQELLDNVFKHLNLIETAYFGLRFIDNTGQTHWLDPGKKVVKQLEGTEPFTLYFGVKFYAADPCKLLEEITRYQFYLQIKQDILQGRLPVPFELAAELGAYAVQSELGDYDPRRHCSGYVSEFRFIANQATELENRVSELHKTMAGQVPAVAELNYLEKVKWLDMYGVDLHPVLGEDNVDYFLGLTPSGVIVLRNKTKVGNYFWPRISKLTHKGKYFMLRVRNKSNEEQTYGFETPSRPACRHLWRCSVEHHAFFRLVQVAPTTTSTKVNSLNARFRDSARSESSVRRRAQPQFVRTPSRRYTRRVVEGAQDSPEVNEIVITDLDQSVSNGIGVNKTISVPQSVNTAGMYRTPSMTMISNNQQRGSESPRSTRSAPWPVPNSGKKNSYSVPSPKSVRSAGVGSSNTREKDRECSHDRKRSASAESNSSADSKSHRKHRHRSRKGSDAESEVSRSSGRSHHSKRRSKNGSSRRDSGSESENCHHHRHRHRHKHRHSSSKYELVDSEVQWREAQKKQAQSASTTVQQASVIPATPTPVITNSSVHTNGISSTPTVRKSGYMNSGLETESEASFQQKRRHRRSQRSRSPEKRLPDELKKHLDFQLIDTEGMSSEQLRQIPYKEIKTSSFKGGKVRYNSSVKSNRSAPVRQHSTENSGPDIKSELPSNGDSPPPPYSPPTSSSSTIISSTHSSKGIDSLSVVSVTPTTSTTITPVSKIVSSQSSFNGRQIMGGSSSQFLVPPPPSKVTASNNGSSMNKNGLPAYDNFGQQVYKTSSHRVPRVPHGEDAGIHDINHPSPSESPDSQKVDSHHENSDSGLGTDHQEYYRGENFSSLSYTLPRSQSKGNLKGHSNGSEYSRTKPQAFTDYTNNHEWLASTNQQQVNSSHNTTINSSGNSGGSFYNTAAKYWTHQHPSNHPHQNWIYTSSSVNYSVDPSTNLPIQSSSFSITI